jgi:serine/threonine-protein kinase RsbW
MSGPLVAQALDEAGPDPQWVSLDWYGPRARLRVAELHDAPSPLPGRVLVPGVNLVHDVLEEVRPLSAGGTEVWIDLPVGRSLERDIDPDPGSATLGHDRDAVLTGLVALAARHAGGDRTPGEVMALAGAIAARDAAALYRERHGVSGPLTAAQVAEAFLDYERALGGDFFPVEVDDDRVVVGNRTCPFGHAVDGTPEVCRFTSALLGGLGGEVAGDTTVTIEEQLAMGDHQCRLVAEVGPGRHPDHAHHYTRPPAGLGLLDLSEADDAYRVVVSLRLPRDRQSVPVIRHLSHNALDEVGVLAEIIDDVDLALTEACANVLHHSGPGDSYDVTVTLGRRCEIRVIDVGRGFDHASLNARMAPVDAEHGRGIALMAALMDQVRLDSEPERGTVVHLVKHLRFSEASPAQRLLRAALQGHRSTGPS